MCLHEDKDGYSTSRTPGHLQGVAETMAELADCMLFWGTSGETFICHTQILAARSSNLATLISIALNSGSYSEEEDGLLRLRIGSSAPTFIQETKLQTTFLRHIYAFEESVKISNFEEASELMRLADWFGCPTVMRNIENWCCNQSLNHFQCPTNSSLDDLCALFALSMNHRLTRLAALLLPWVLSKLNRGPLGDGSMPWRDVQVRLDLLQSSMGSDIRSIVLDLQWWSCGMPQRCRTCECRSGDLANIVSSTTQPSFINNLGQVPYCHTPTSATNSNGGASSVVKALPGTYASIAAHVAHTLVSCNWGCTPATSSSLGSFFPF